jgi:hypothetical protein
MSSVSSIRSTTKPAPSTKAIPPSASRPNVQPNTLIVNQLLLPLVSDLIFSYLAFSPQQLTLLSLVCYKWNKDIITNSNHIWEILCKYKWKHISSIANPDSWLMFYRKRLERLKTSYTKESVIPIENCLAGYELQSKVKKPTLNDYSTGRLPTGLEWSFECPVALNRLQKTTDDTIDICEICNKNVYLVKNEQELRERVDKKQCVAFAEEDIIGGRKEAKERRAMKMGEIRALPKPYKDEQ